MDFLYFILFLVVFAWLFKSSVSIENFKQATEDLTGKRYVDKTNKEIEKLRKEVSSLRQELEELKSKI